MAPGILVAGILVAASVGEPALIVVLIAYYLLSSAYSVSLKRRMILDIFILAFLYTIRIFSGAVATDIPVSVWLIAFSIFIFLSLASMKRQAELIDTEVDDGREISRRAYSRDDLPIISMMAISAGYVAVLILALYLNSEAVGKLYGNPEILWVTCAVVLYWINRMIFFAHRGMMTDDPIIFAVRDRTSQLCGVVVAVAVAVSILL